MTETSTQAPPPPPPAPPSTFTKVRKQATRVGALLAGLWIANELWKEYSPLSVYHNPDWEHHVRRSKFSSFAHEDSGVRQYLGKNSSMLVLPIEPFTDARSEGSVLICNPICVPEDQMREIEALGQVDVLLIPNRGSRRDLRAWTERFPRALVVCPQQIKGAVERVTPVSKTTEQLLTKPWRGVQMHQPEGVRSWVADQVYEYDLRAGQPFESKESQESQRALLLTGGVGYYTSTSNLLRNYLLHAQEFSPTVSRWSQRLHVSDRNKYGLWLKEQVEDLQPKVLFLQSQSHGGTCHHSPYFTKPIVAVEKLNEALGVKAAALQITFPDISPEEQIAALERQIAEVSAKSASALQLKS